MRRQKRKSNTRFLLPVIVAVALLFTGHIAVDQYRLFTRYHTQIAEKKTQIKLLESEVRELETDLKEAESFPFIMKFEGTWENIDKDLQKIQKLPFIVRAVTINIEISEKVPGSVILRYGGFLYVNETFN